MVWVCKWPYPCGKISAFHSFSHLSFPSSPPSLHWGLLWHKQKQTTAPYHHQQIFIIPSLELCAGLRTSKATVSRTTSMLEEDLQLFPSLCWGKPGSSLCKEEQKRGALNFMLCHVTCDMWCLASCIAAFSLGAQSSRVGWVGGCRVSFLKGTAKD